MRPEGAEEFRAALDVSRETSERLETYAALLGRWNERINLVSRTSLAQLWSRHILDSAQLFALAGAQLQNWADLGSGGGFPGLVVAILAAESAPGLRMTLVESDGRKAAFLATAVRELGLSVAVRQERIEARAPLGAQILSARALAPLDDLLGYAVRHLAPGGRALFLKGASHGAEIAAARAHWSFELQIHPSKSGADGVILEIGAPVHV